MTVNCELFLGYFLDRLYRGSYKPFMGDNILAKLNLAWAFFLHCLKWPLLQGKDGYQQFLDNYATEGLIALSRSDKDWLLKFSGCFNCGICDSVCTALLEKPREVFPGPSYLATTLTRSTTQFWAAGLDFSHCEGCELCQKVCPNHVPIQEAFRFIREKTLAPFPRLR